MVTATLRSKKRLLTSKKSIPPIIECISTLDRSRRLFRQQRVATGYSSPARFNSASCTVNAGGGTVSANLYSSGSYRSIGYAIPVGQSFGLALHTTGLEAGASGECTYDIGGRTMVAPFTTVASAPNPTYLMSLPSLAGLSPGQVVITRDYQLYGNKTAAQVQVDAGSQIEIDKNGNWIEGGSPQRIPYGSTFRIRATAPASGQKTITLRQSENLGLRQFFTLDTGAPDTSLVGRLPSQIFAVDHTVASVGGHTSVGQPDFTLPTSFNECVPMTLTGGFNVHQFSNSGHAYYDKGWSSNITACPGDRLRLAVHPPQEAGVRIEGSLRIGDWSQRLTILADGPNFDLDPDAFSFTDIGNAIGETRIVSSPIVPTGYNVPVRAEVSGDGTPSVSINNGAWTTSSVRIAPGDSIRVSLTSGPEDGTTRRATVRIGTTQTTWSVTTPSLVAAPLVFAAAADVDPSANLVSEQVTIAGLGAGLQANATVTGPGNPTLSVNGGTQRATALVRNGDRVRLYASAPAGYGASSSVALKVGATTGTWSIVTRAEDRIPDPFVVPTLEGRAPGSLVTSAPVTPVGYRDTAAVTVTGPEAEISIDGGPWATSGTIEPGESFTLRLRAAPTPGTLATAAVTVGGVEATWNVATAE